MQRKKPQHVVVFGPNEFTQHRLERIDPGQFVIHPLFTFEEVDHWQGHFDWSFQELLESGERQLNEVERIDGIASFWDFPATVLAAVLASRRGLPGPSLESVLKCEHKYWSRCLQREVIPDMVPDFQHIDPFDDDLLSKLRLKFPFWLKPIKGASSTLGFRIENEDDFRHAIERMRKGIGVMGNPFTEVLNMAHLPEEQARAGGNMCIAESLIGGEEVTIEGYVHRGEVHFQGVVDSIRHSNSSTFSRYEYPSKMAPAVIERIESASKSLLEHFGYDQATFNVEFFYEEEQDQLWLVEVNSRISQSHAKLFELVDGVSNFSELLNVAVGNQPPPHPGGEYACAAKLFYRTSLADATVTAVPSREEIEAIEQSIPGVEVHLSVDVGAHLAEMANQDSYTFELATLHIGAHDEGELLQKYQECVDRLSFAFGSINPADVTDGHVQVEAIPQVLQRSAS